MTPPHTGGGREGVCIYEDISIKLWFILYQVRIVQHG